MNQIPNNPSVFRTFFKRLQRKRAFKIFLKAFRRLILGIVVLAFALYLLLQLNAVQNWLVQKATTRLSAQLETEVSLKEIDFRFFDQLVLTDLFIADLNQDTLLFASELKTSMSANLLALFNGRYDLDDINLNGAQINLNTLPFEHESNLQKLLAKLIKEPDTTNVKKPIYLDLQNVRLTDVQFNNTNQSRGFFQYFTIPKGEIVVNKLDLSTLDFQIEKILIENPDVRLELHPGKDSISTIVETIPKEEKDPADSASTIIRLGSLNIVDATFTFHNIRKAPVKITPDSLIDYRHLFLENINVGLKDFYIDAEKYEGVLSGLAFKESSGFELTNFTSDHVLIDNKAARFNDMSMETPFSTMGDTLIFKYRKFTDLDYFNDKVLLDLRVKNSRLALRDIMAFAPGLKSNAFFQKNRDEHVDISGKFTGRVNNLKGRNIKILLDERTRLSGDFNSRNLTLRNQEVLNLELDRLQTDMQTLRLLIPNFNPPANFDKLGDLDFNGRFDGFFVDFVAYGALRTDLGNAEVDMRMDLTQGRQDASYSGKLSLEQFDMGRWADNPELGMVSLSSEVEEGFGLTLEKINTELSAKIDRFEFRKYTYENVDVTGRITKNLFDGDLLIKDDNVDLTFSGAIQFGDTIPEFDFSATVNKLDLKAVNLSKRDISFTGAMDLNLVDTDIAKFRGTATGSNLMVIENGIDTFTLDSLNLNTALIPGGKRTLSFFSEILIAEIDGEYVLNEIPEAFLQYFQRNFPHFSNRLNIKSKSEVPLNTSFTFDVQIPDSKNFLKLADQKLGRIQKASFEGRFDTRKNELVTNLDVPNFTYDNVSFDEIIVSIDGDEKSNNIYLEVNESHINNFKLEPITLRGDMHQDTLEFQINALSWTSILDNLQLKGIFTVSEDFFNIQLLPSNLAILRENWRIAENNYIRFDKDYLDIQNILLTNGNRSIGLSSSNNKSLNATLENFKFSIIDEYWDYPKLDFEGNFDLNADVEDIFNLKGLNLNISSDTLFVNGEDWGVLRLDAQAPDITDEIYAYFSITRGDGQLTAEGHILPPEKVDAEVPGIDFNLNVSHYPLHIAEYWLGNGVSNTTGNFDAALKLGGLLNNVNTSGDIRVYDGAMTIDFLQTRYFIKDEIAKVNNFLFDVTGAVVTDSMGNVARLSGGITHNHLRNLGLDVSMTANNFLALNTTKEDNKTFYGFAMANGVVYFSGSFRQPNISINAAPTAGTNIIFPMSGEQDASEVTFIDFIDKSDTLKATIEPSELLGVAMDMTLALNENALMELVFDEKTGDIIKGTGSGDVQLDMDRSGNFSMRGNYFVNSGEYLFTAFDFINKPFNIKQGGSIRWNGNPYNADINIQAEYLGLNASVYNFISEYEIPEDIRSQARQATRVDLSMDLLGQLLSPDIYFNLSFPEISGDVKNYVESKLISIRQDPNELNRQVFGLMVLGTFLPRNQGSTAATTSLVDLGINTVSEFLTSQLSLFFTDLFSGAIRDGKFLSGIQFDIGYNRYEDLTDEGGSLVNNEIGVRPKFFFWDDRLTLDFGGDVNFGQSSSGTAYFGTDVVVEFALSKNRRLKAKLYQVYDQSYLGIRSQTGVGLSYKREGDSFKELFSRTKKKPKKNIGKIETE